MINLPSFMQGVDFFETSLQEGITVSDDQILLPSTDMAKIPAYPFPLVIGGEGEEELVLAYEPGRTSGVLNGRIRINRSIFGTPVRGYGQDTRVMCSPSYEYLKELQNYVTELASEYRGLAGAVGLLLFGDTSTDGVWDLAGGLVASKLNGSAHVIQVTSGIATVNERIVSLVTTTPFDTTPLTQTLSYGVSVQGLLYITQFGALGMLLGEPGYGVPSPPENTVPLASCLLSLLGFADDAAMVDERGTLLTQGN